MPLPALALPIGLKIGSALANHFSNKKYEKKARKSAANDALVAALSQGQVQSDSTPDYKPSKLGAGLGFAGDMMGLYQMLGGMNKAPGVMGSQNVPQNLYDGNYNNDKQKQLEQFFGTMS